MISVRKRQNSFWRYSRHWSVPNSSFEFLFLSLALLRTLHDLSSFRISSIKGQRIFVFCSDETILSNMPPDRPDASGIETDIKLNSSQDYKFGETAYTMNDKEKENTSVLADANSTNKYQSEVPRCEKSVERTSQPDDELTSLSWLHQQNLLKGLEISNPSKDMKHENLLNNNICEDMADFSENTNSISSLDDSFCSGKKTHIRYLSQYIY